MSIIENYDRNGKTYQIATRNGAVTGKPMFRCATKGEFYCQEDWHTTPEIAIDVYEKVSKAISKGYFKARKHEN